MPIYGQPPNTDLPGTNLNIISVTLDGLKVLMNEVKMSLSKILLLPGYSSNQTYDHHSQDQEDANMSVTLMESLGEDDPRLNFDLN